MQNVIEWNGSSSVVMTNGKNGKNGKIKYRSQYPLIKLLDHDISGYKVHE